MTHVLHIYRLCLITLQVHLDRLSEYMPFTVLVITGDIVNLNQRLIDSHLQIVSWHVMTTIPDWVVGVSFTDGANKDNTVFTQTPFYHVHGRAYYETEEIIVFLG